MKRQINLLVLVVFLFLISCDRPNCTNTNPVFDQFTPDKIEYKKEFLKEMQSEGMENLRYWFDKSLMLNGQEYYELHVKSEKLCAKIIVLNKQQERDLGNGGYRGAELSGVTLNTEYKNGDIIFVLEGIEKILD